MSISPFFRTLRTAYQAEIDDSTFDSEGKNILRQRLTQRRKELPFLLQMMELSPEMVAVVFHQAFRFKLPGALEHLVSHASEDLPTWDTLSDTITLAPWAQDLAATILKQPQGEWFMSVAAGLEYLHGQPEGRDARSDDDEENDEYGEHEEGVGAEDLRDNLDDEDISDPRAREDAAADWMVEQGFDRKD